MFNRTLTTILAFTCLFSISNGDDKYASFKDLKKIPDGMNVVHNGEGTTAVVAIHGFYPCLLYTSPSPRDRTRSRMPSSA